MDILNFLIKKKKLLIILNIFGLLFLITNAIYRDFQLEKQYPQDLRNRIVGARLIQSARLPYFYKWHQGDSETYKDIKEAGSEYKINLITASPFFHRLIIPIAGFQFYTISKIWLLSAYICWFVIVFFSLQLCATNLQKLLTVNLAVLFTYTEGWILHNMIGQSYIIIATFILVIAYLLIRDRFKFYLLAGVMTAMLVYIRPNSLVFLLPFLTVYKSYLKYLMASFFFLVLYGVFVLCNTYESSLWKEYLQAIPEHIKYHQGHPSLQKNETFLLVDKQEGFDFREVKAEKEKNKNDYAEKSECVNFYILYALVTGKQINLRIFNALYFITVSMLLFLLYKRQKIMGLSTFQIVCFGISLYLLTDFFTPIGRLQYYTVQFLPAILLPLSQIRKIKELAPFLLTVGVILNITNTPLIPIRHTIGEFIILGVLFWVSTRKIQEP